MYRRARDRNIARLPIIVLTLLIAGFGPAHASTPSAMLASSSLSMTTDFSGTGTLVEQVRTATLRDGVPEAGRAARVLVIGTGVQRALFPQELQPSIIASGTDATDTHGFGTLAVSTLLQLLPDARITVKRVRPLSASFTLVDTASLASLLESAYTARDSYDLVLFAFPPQGALDPISHLQSHVRYTEKFGTGVTQLVEALLVNKPPTDGHVSGIPLDRKLRDLMFARLNARQRDAVERYALQTIAWRRVLAAVDKISDAGVTMVAPAGDYTHRVAEQIQPLPTQTVFGIAALPEVLTVGAVYRDGEIDRVSPTSGRGPTLTLAPKPEVVAPSDVLGLLPANAWLTWKDDSLRAPLSKIDWAAPGASPSLCPSVPQVYRCVLQGSTVVSASVVAANVASLAAAGVPNDSGSRAAPDNEVVRALAWRAAAGHDARAYRSDREATPFEAGAGVFPGFAGAAARTVPIPIGSTNIGEVGWRTPKTKTISMWGSGDRAARATARITSFVGPNETGEAVMLPYENLRRVTASVGDAGVTLTVAGGEYQGGVYGGDVTITSSDGDATTIPFSFIQDLPLDFHADYAYNEFSGHGIEGERVERATMILTAGVPTNIGLIGTAFKNFSSTAFRNVGGDPTNSVMIRYGTTKDTFTDTTLPASEHGRGRIDAVPPGFYKMHLATDHAIEAVQSRGTIESIGMQLASSGPDAVITPGSNVLIPSRPPCSKVSSAEGPLASNCLPRAGELDPNNGLCVVRNGNTRVSFNVYCGEVAYAVPSAVVSRAVHIVQHDADPVKSEWKTCGVNVPLDGSHFDFGEIVKKASMCSGTTSPTMWDFPPQAPSCLGPTEKAAYPNGHPDDATARYFAPGPLTVPGRNLPVGVMTYKFKIPTLNTYTTAGLSFSYAADNAIVAVRYKTGDDAYGDASTGVLVVDDPDVSVTPALRGAPARGSVFQEWAMMSSNAPVGELSFIVIPTAWTRPDLDPTKAAASVQFCDVAMRVSTYAKAGWGKSATENGVPSQFLTMDDQGLHQQIDPGVKRIRPIYRSGSFVDHGTESEDLHAAIQIPKNTTRASAPHRVRSPLGGAAYAKGARSFAGGSRGASIVQRDFETYDPRYGVTALDCNEATGISTVNPSGPAAGEICQLYHKAQASNEVVATLLPEMSVNGRFAGIMPIDHAQIARAGGDVAFEIADADDGGAFDNAGHWVTKDGSYVKRFRVSNFYGDDLTPLTLSIAAGIVQVARDSAGNALLQVITPTGGGTTYNISSLLR